MQAGHRPFSRVQKEITHMGGAIMATSDCGRPFNQFESRMGAESGRHVMIGLARFLAAHSPTPGAEGQTYQIALRLQRCEELFQ